MKVTSYLFRFRLLAGLLTLAFWCAPAMQGQSVSGSITGQITDPSGAAVAGADVKVVNVQTGVESIGKSNGSGYFNVSNLIVGAYRVDVAASGFKGASHPDISVAIGSVVRLDIQLQVGNVNERVTVTGEAAQIQTEKVELGGTIDQKALQALPSEGRNPTRLAGIQAGVIMDNGNEGVPSTSGSANYTFQVNGARSQMNRQLLDGVEDTEGVSGAAAIVPSTDALQEFQLVTSNYDVELGQVAGAVQLFTTKAGTNQIHGSAHEFNRVNALFAANPFSEPDGPGHFVYNQFGGTLGGPIIKNKLFAFGYYEGYRVRSGGNALTTVPIAAFRNGDFSSIAATNPIYDPTTGGPGGVGRTQFAGNIIPADRLDPIAQAMMAKLPLPNLPGTDNNFIAPQINPLNQNLGTIRVDYTATSATQIFGRFTRQKADQSSIVPAYGEMIFPGSAISRGNQNSAVGNITHVFTPNLVVEGRFGWTLNQWSQDEPDQNSTTSQDFGIPGLNDACSACGGLAGFRIGGPVGSFAFGNNDHSHQVDNYGNYNFVEIATWNHGPHSFKFGSDTLLAWRDRRDTSSQGGFGCGAGICEDNGFSQNITGSADVAGSGLSTATFLLGDVSSFGRVIYATALPEAHNTHQAFFGQDTWHVTPKLTLTLGVRWDYLGYPTSPQKGGIANFNFTNTNTIVSDFGDSTSTANVEQNHNAWAPRLGFAYRVQNNTVVRAGFGRTYAIGFYGANFGAITNDWPNATRQNVKQDDIYQPILTLAGGPPAFVSGFDILAAAGNPGQYPTPNSTGFGTNFHNPENSIDQWNATVQHQFGNDLTVSASYVGNAVRHMFYRYDANAVLPGPGTSLDARRPYAAFGFLTNAYNQSNQTSSGYQGAQLQVQKRYSHGLMFTSAFTYGRSYDFGLHNAFDPFDTNESRGPQDNDRRFVLVFSHVWELPFGKGQAYLNKGGVTDAVLGGWHISGIETFESGLPYSVTWGDTSQLNSDCCTLVADITGDPHISDQNASHWFNPGAFAQPGLYLQGDSGRNSFRGPGFVGVDLSLSKTFPITERIAFELQWEAYNAINHRNLSQPDGTADSSTAGQIFGITGTMRRMQVGGTLRF